MILTSCSLMNKTTKNSEAHQYEMTSNNSLKTDLQQEKLTLTDSVFDSDQINTTSFDVFLWPKGNLKFTADGGMEGNFDSVLVKGQRAQKTKTHGKLLRKITDKSALLTQIEEQKKEKVEEKKLSKKSLPDGKFILAILILVIILLIYAKKGLSP